MNSTWALSLMVELLLVLLAWFSAVHFESWLAPGAFYAILWAGFVGVSLVFAPANKIWPGVWWFLLMAGVVQVGAAIGGGSPRRRLPIRRGAPSISALRWVNIVCVLVGVVGVEILLRSIGEGLTSLANPVAVALNGVVFSYLRYNRHGFREPSAYVALTTFVYLSAYLSGLQFGLSRRRSDRAIAMLVFVPVLLIGITLTTRGPILFCVIIWLASFLATGVWSGRVATRFRLGPRSVAWAGLLSALLVVVYVGLQALRSGAPFRRDAKFDPVHFGLAQAQSAYVGSLAAFSTWFADNWDSLPPPGLGRYSFASAYQWLGGEQEFQRFGEAQVSDDPDTPTTNVFTIYRYWGEDFTLPGSAVLVLMLGILGGWSYRRVQDGAFNRVPFLAMYYQISFISLTGFAMRDTTIQGAFIFLLIFTRLARRRTPAIARRAVAGLGESVMVAR